MKWRVVAPYGQGAASARVRAFEWVARIDQPEPEILDHVGAATTSLIRMAGSPRGLIHAELGLRKAARTRVDVVFMHLGASPFSRGSIERRLLASGSRGVVDFDDSVQWDWRPGLAGIVKNPLAFLQAARAADIVIAGNDVLANWAAGWCDHIAVIPSCVEPSDYEEKSTYDIARRPQIGWLGSPSTERYLRKIEPALLALHDRLDAELVVVSTGARSLGRLDAMVKRVEWSPTVQANVGSIMDVGVMPLEDTVWARGKCGYKLLQYAAAGLPAVASPIGVNSEIAATLGYRCATSDADWIEELAHLLSCTGARAEQGALARTRVEARYSYSTWLPEWKRAVFGADRFAAP